MTPADALRESVELFMAGRLEEARRACRKLLAGRPDLAEGHQRVLGEMTGDLSRR